MSFITSVTLPELGLGAGYAIWGFRAIAMGHGDCPVLIRGFEHTFGNHSERAHRAVSALANEMNAGGRRRIKLAMPGCGFPTADELSVVAMLSAAQQGDTLRSQTHLAWLMHANCSDAALIAAISIGAAFDAVGMTIEAPQVEIVGMIRGPVKVYHDAGHA